MANHPIPMVSVIVTRDSSILLGKRKQEPGKGCWGFPEGELGYRGEILPRAREIVMEKAGIDIAKPKIVTATNDIFDGDGAPHYITFFIGGKYKQGGLNGIDRKEYEMFDWFSWNKMPKGLYLPVMNLMAQWESQKDEGH